MDRAALLLQDVKLDGIGLEVGPLASPLVQRQDARQIFYADYAHREVLCEKSRNNPRVNVAAIPDIDFAISSLADYDRIEQRFDYIIASHVIEHTPDWIGWLEKMLSLLNPGGRLVLAVPDKRYCFDYYRPPSTLGDALEAYYERRERPTFRQIFDGCTGARRNLDPLACWEGRVEGTVPHMTTMRALMVAKRAAQEGRYVDVHCWVWTFESFMQALASLRELRILSPKIIRTMAPQHYWNEFHIVLAA